MLEAAAEPILRARAGLRHELSGLEKMVRNLAKQDRACQLLMTMPGVGAVIALTFTSAPCCRTVSSRSSTLFRLALGNRLGPGIMLAAAALTTDGSESLATDIRGIVDPSPCRAHESVTCFCQGNHLS